MSEEETHGEERIDYENIICAANEMLTKLYDEGIVNGFIEAANILDQFNSLQENNIEVLGLLHQVRRRCEGLSSVFERLADTCDHVISKILEDVCE